MTTPAYPVETLPHSPLIDTWQIPDLYQDPLVTDMEGGNKRMRGRPGDNVMRTTFDILYTQAQWAIYKAFIKNTLHMGLARFTMPIEFGDGEQTKLVQYASKPKPTSVSPFIRVTHDLWVFNAL